MKIILQTLILITLFSCGKTQVSEVEVKAVDQVLMFYGGKVERFIGVNSENGNKIDFFELKIKESNLLNSDINWLDEHAGNIAYLFYSNLNNEKTNYDEIRVTIEVGKNESHKYKFTGKELKEVETFYTEIQKTNNYIKNADYSSLVNQFNKKIEVNENEINKLFTKIKSEYGEIKNIQIQGFSFDRDEEFGNYVRFKVGVIQEKISATMVLSYSRGETKELVGLYFP